jgi:hypothetical protein
MNKGKDGKPENWRYIDAKSNPCVGRATTTQGKSLIFTSGYQDRTTRHSYCCSWGEITKGIFAIVSELILLCYHYYTKQRNIQQLTMAKDMKLRNGSNTAAAG